MKEFESILALKAVINKKTVKNIAVQSLDLTTIESKMLGTKFKSCLFLGCKMSEKLWQHLHLHNFIFPVMDAPFEVYPNQLYSKETLYNNCLLYTSPSPRDATLSRMPSSA